MWKPNFIMVGDSRDLSSIGKDKVSLTVTSPPYHNAINYNEHQNKSKMVSRNRGGLS